MRRLIDHRTHLQPYRRNAYKLLVLLMVHFHRRCLKQVPILIVILFITTIIIRTRIDGDGGATIGKLWRVAEIGVEIVQEKLLRILLLHLHLAFHIILVKFILLDLLYTFTTIIIIMIFFRRWWLWWRWLQYNILSLLLNSLIIVNQQTRTLFLLSGRRTIVQKLLLLLKCLSLLLLHEQRRERRNTALTIIAHHCSLWLLQQRREIRRRITTTISIGWGLLLGGQRLEILLLKLFLLFLKLLQHLLVMSRLEFVRTERRRLLRLRLRLRRRWSRH